MAVDLWPPPKPNRSTYPYVGRLRVPSLPEILVETKAGQVREGKDWRRVLRYHYGEFKGTIGTDGDPVDVYLGPDPMNADRAYVVHQKDPGTRSYDEDKVMLGWPTRAAAIAAYRRQYDGLGFYGGCTTWGIEELAEALKEPKRRGKPLVRNARTWGALGLSMAKAEQLGLFHQVRLHARKGRVVRAHRRKARKHSAGPAAPQPGERGHQPSEPTRPGVASVDAARTIMAEARRYWNDPDFWQALNTDDAAALWSYRDVPDLLSVPRTVEGLEIDDHVREAVADYAIDLAGKVAGEDWAVGVPLPAAVPTISETRKVDGKRTRVDTGVPRVMKQTDEGVQASGGAWRLWEPMAEALLADALHEYTTGKRASARLVDVPVPAAIAFVHQHHSALPTFEDRGVMFALGVQKGRRLAAVALAGTPSGRWADPHSVLELYRVASDGTVAGAASRLTARMIDLVERSAREGATSPPRLVTYSLLSEAGSTYAALRDKGMRPTAFVRGRAGPAGARRSDGNAALRAEPKIRWEAGPGAAAGVWELLEMRKARRSKQAALETEGQLGMFASPSGATQQVPVKAHVRADPLAKAEQQRLAFVRPHVRPHVRGRAIVRGHIARRARAGAEAGPRVEAEAARRRHRAEGVLHFASGSSSLAPLRAFVDLGRPVGVAVDRLHGLALAQLDRNHGVPVFVDSGAFSEVDADMNVVAPIGEAEWSRRLDVYERIAKAQGSDAYLVMPDRVGDAAYSLSLLRRYRDRIDRLASMGAQIIVPLQDTRDLAAAHDAVSAILGREDWIPGIPSMKGATEPAALHAYLGTHRPEVVHLLGMGPRSKGWPTRREILEAAGVDAQLDSVVVRSMAGRTRGPGGTPSAYTQARIDAAERLADTRWSDTSIVVPHEHAPALGLDYTDLIGQPSVWLSMSGRRQVADAAGLARKQTRQFVRDPDRFVGDPMSGALVEFELDAAWAAWLERMTGPSATYEALTSVLRAQEA